MPRITFHYWAGARAAAGTEFADAQAHTLTEAIAEAGRDQPELARVLSVCSFLQDGLALDADARSRPLVSDVTIEVLPPFAGG